MISFILLSLVYIFCVLSLVLEGWKYYIRRAKLKNLILLKAPPIIGNVVDFQKCDNEGIFDFANIMMEKHNVDPDAKGIFMWMGPFLFMWTHHPDAMAVILNSTKALKKSYQYGFIRNSAGLLTSEPTKWKLHRKALNPTLGPKMVKSFIPILNEKFKRMTNLMDRQVGQPIDIYLYMFRCATDAMLQSSFDVNWSVQNHLGTMFRDFFVSVFGRMQSRAFSIVMKSDLIYKQTESSKLDDEAYPKFHRFIESLLETKRVDLAEKLEDGIDELEIVKNTYSANFLQKCLLMQMENTFDDKDICEEMQTVLIASIDTTSLTVNAIALLLAIYPEYQERVVEELQSVFSDVDEPVMSHHLPQLKFLELVIKEGLRLFPAAPFLGREATEDIPFEDGVIPKGTTIALSVYRTNRHPTFWGENANEFYPERFLPENCVDHHPYQYIPFSAGLRNCIGMRYAWASLKISLAYLLRRYRFTTNLKSIHDIKIWAGVVMKIKNKDALFIERRKW